jgi:hypothetical protein
MCVCGVSLVIILELEFYSNGQGIASCAHQSAQAWRRYSGKAEMQRRRIKTAYFQMTVAGARNHLRQAGRIGPGLIGKLLQHLLDLDIGGRQQSLVVAISSVNAIELIDARYWNG